MYTQGKIVSWDVSKGFGFARTLQAKQDVFVHISDFDASEYLPVVDQEISFILKQLDDGKFRAEEITFCGKKRQRRPKQIGKFVPLVLISFMAFLLFTTQTGKLPSVVALYYLLMSGITYFSYARDKRAAIAGNWRVSEFSLQLQSLLGGWPGAWFAQLNLRHKSKKQSFKWLFYITVLANLGALSWLFSEPGSLYIHSLAINLNFYLLSLPYIDFIQLWWWKLDYWLNNFRQTG